MSKNDRFTSVWDALEDDPVRQENLKLRSALMMQIAERIKDQGLTQTQAAEMLHITQPRVSALLKGKMNDFRLDSLVDIRQCADGLPLDGELLGRIADRGKQVAAVHGWSPLIDLFRGREPELE